jgi:hypothetical protein
MVALYFNAILEGSKLGEASGSLQEAKLGMGARTIENFLSV